MRNSIRMRLIIILMAFIVLFVAVNMFMNLSFLEKYYSYEKEKTLEEIYTQTKKLCVSEESSMTAEERYYALNRLADNNGVSLYIFSVYYDGFYNNYSFHYPDVDVKSKVFRMVIDHVENYVNSYYGFGEIEGNYSLEKETNYYDIYKVFDEQVDSNYLELFGKMNKSTFVYVRANYQNIAETAMLSNKFISGIGIGALIVGAIAMFFIGNRFTKPVLELAQIADRMADLDFDAKYEGTYGDEIGKLGNNMNILSEKLQDTISELKSANNELLKDIERKEEADEMRQEFLSNVSHELKTPIALIQGYAEGLCDGVIEDAEDRKYYCEVIMDEACKMNRMVKSLLDLNQLEFGNDKPSFERFDIVEVLKSVLKSSDIVFKQKNIELIMYEPNPVFVWADEYLVEQILTNYISNAVNHVSGENKIEVFTKKKENSVRISVRNTGECIPSEDIDKIWGKFYKVDKARTREYGGNGIGLSIVKAIMKRFNRECGVINHSDGVEFWFELDPGFAHNM